VLQGVGRDRDVEPGDALDRRLLVAQHLLLDAAGDLCAEPQVPELLVDDDGPPGLAERRLNGGGVQRRERPQVHDFDVDLADEIAGGPRHRPSHRPPR